MQNRLLVRAAKTLAGHESLLSPRYLSNDTSYKKYQKVRKKDKGAERQYHDDQLSPLVPTITHVELSLERVMSS